MKTIFETADRDSVLARIDRVTDASKPLWGKMTADRMLAHLVESMKMATGELPTKSKDLPIRFWPLKQLIIYVFPFPKGAPTAPELLAGPERHVDALKTELREQVAKVGSRGSTAEWPKHPAFGRLSPRAWGALAYKHINHHLRQFGV